MTNLEIKSINIYYGIWDTLKDTAFKMEGFWGEETREYLPMAIKLVSYVSKKANKFYEKYLIRYTPFVLGRDPIRSIETVAVCHLHFDAFNAEVGEKIVVGRIKKMRGDLKKVVYETEMVKKEIFLYSYTDKKTGEKVDVHKTIEKKQLKCDIHGNPIVKRKHYFHPYNLYERRDCTIVGELKYPYIAVMVE